MGDALQRQFGPAALDILNEALDDALREIDQAFGSGSNGRDVNHYDDESSAA